jgi:predicted DNA-binding protein
MALGHTTNMKRTTIWLTDFQVKKLAKLSKKTGTKQAELIRRFIDAALAKEKQ